MKSDNCAGIFVTSEIADILMLLFADDLTLFAYTVVALQKKLNTLNTFCRKWNFSVNLEKSNIITFKNGGGQKHSEKLTNDNNPIALVSNYKYLGVVFTSRLNWNLCS